jgi:GPH family glycoside/pentoside/hexuronide:cation symporter
MFNWSAVDMIAVSFPYFLLYWVAQGNPLEHVQVFGFQVALQSAFFGVLMLICILFVPFWLRMAKLFDKRQAYVAGMIFWVIVQMLIFTIPPHNIPYLLTIAALAGVGVSAAYVLPDSLFADIIEWDELLTRRRHEGIYFGARAFIRKLTGAFVIFITLQTLGWSGYQTPPEGITTFTQSADAQLMIRLLVSPIGAAILLGAVVFAWLFPLTRERYGRIQRLLEKRRERAATD